MTVLKKSVCGLSLKTSCYIIGWAFMIAALISCARLAFMLSSGRYTLFTATSHHSAASAKVNGSVAPTAMPTAEFLNASRGQAAEMDDQDTCTADEGRLPVVVFLLIILFLVLPANIFLVKGTTNNSSICIMVWLVIYSPIAFANFGVIISYGIRMYKDDGSAWIIFYGAVLHLPMLLYLWLLVFSHFESVRTVRGTAIKAEGAEHVRLSVVCREVRVRTAASSRQRGGGGDHEDDQQRHAALDPLTGECTPPPTYSECHPAAATGKDRAAWTAVDSL